MRRIDLRFLASIIVFIIFVSSLAISFIPEYTYHIQYIQSNLNFWNGYQYDPYGDGRVFNWIKNNTFPDSILMARDLRNWAWFTDRICIGSSRFNITGGELQDLIRRYEVNYLIVDYDFYLSYPNLQLLYFYPSVAPLGFKLVYNTSNPQNNLRVLIYNVTLIQSFPNTPFGFFPN